jgi:hypothetical protein
VKAVLRGIRRTIGAAKQGKAPATADVLTDMVALCPDSMIGRRDRALLCLGFAGAFRRSELCALEVGDLTEVPDGLRILIRRSKGDQEGQGAEVAIPRGYRLRPVEAVQVWLAAAEISNGPVFRASSGAGRTGIVRGPGGRQRGADREAVCPARGPGSGVWCRVMGSALPVTFRLVASFQPMRALVHRICAATLLCFTALIWSARRRLVCRIRSACVS